MREIKFRAYDAFTGTMIQDWLVQKDGFEFDGYDTTNNRVDIKGIMQFTGLKDKNGADIYEGDIVDNDTGKYKGEITFENGCFLHRDSPLGYFVEDGVIEDNRSGPEDKITLQVGEVTGWAIVIGNIYQNHELLTTI